MLPIEWRASADVDLFEILNFISERNEQAAEHPNYIALYRVTATCVEVVNVVHARRQFPDP